MLIAVLITGPAAAKEFQTLLYTLDLWHSGADVFINTDDATATLLEKLRGTTRAQLHIWNGMNAYTGLTRSDMEAMAGETYATRFHDYTMEKCVSIERAFAAKPVEARQEGVWFLDVDITLLAPLPTELVVGKPDAVLGVSPHLIRPVDEARFGRYNAGFLWFRDTTPIDVWRHATYSSHFFEQASIEAMVHSVGPAGVVEFPAQDNFGWWRYLQSVDAPTIHEARLGFFRSPTSCGLTYGGVTLRSIHTHWAEGGGSLSCGTFNTWIRGALERVAKSHGPAKALLGHLRKSAIRHHI